MFHKYPYTDFHELNLDGILAEWKKFLNEFQYTNDRLNGFEKEIDDKFAYYEAAFEEFQNYFDNLDVTEEVQEYMQEYLQELYNGGTLREWFDEAIAEFSGTALTDTSYYRPFAQAFPAAGGITNTHSQEGFCIGRKNNRPVSCSCFFDSDQGLNDKIVFHYLDTGELIGRYNMDAGHCNSVTYVPEKDAYYVACSGGNSTHYGIVQINDSGQVLGYTELDPSGITGSWGIAYNNGRIYVLQGSQTLKICDTDLNILDTKTISYLKPYGMLGQGLFADDNYLYMPTGYAQAYYSYDNIQYIQVFTHEAIKVKDIVVACPLELEECDIYDGQCYGALNYQSFGQIIIMDLYAGTKTGYLGYERLGNDLDVSQDIYINPNQDKYFADGTSENPYPTYARIDAWISGAASIVNMYLQDNVGITFSYHGNMWFKFTLDGQNHTIPRVNIGNGGQVTIKNVTILGEDNNYSIRASCDTFIATYVTLGAANSAITPSHLLWISAAYDIEHMTFNHISSGTQWYLEGGGYLRNLTLNKVLTSDFNVAFFGSVDVDGTIRQFYSHLRDQFQTLQAIQFYQDSTIDTDTEIHYPARISTGASVTFTNAPAGFTSGLTGVMVEEITDNKFLLTFIKTDGTTATKFVTA